MNSEPAQLRTGRLIQPGQICLVIRGTDILMSQAAQSPDEAGAIGWGAASYQATDNGLEVAQRRIARALRSVEPTPKRPRRLPPIIVALIHGEAHDPEQSRHRD